MFHSVQGSCAQSSDILHQRVYCKFRWQFASNIQHLTAKLIGQMGLKFLKGLTNHVNVILEEKVTDDLRPYFSEKLIAL